MIVFLQLLHVTYRIENNHIVSLRIDTYRIVWWPYRLIPIIKRVYAVIKTCDHILFHHLDTITFRVCLIFFKHCVDLGIIDMAITVQCTQAAFVMFMMFTLMIYHVHKWRSFNKEMLFPDFCKCYINSDNLITPCKYLANANLKVFITIFEINSTSISQNMPQR